MPTLLSSRALQDDLAFVEEQLRHHTDPYDTQHVMWEQRRRDIQDQLGLLDKMHTPRAEVALLFKGSPVRGTEEIRLGFATKMLDQYQAFVGTFAAERGGAVVASKGQLPRSFASRLYIRDMLRGSVGFLLEEPEPEQGSLVPTALREAVDDCTVSLKDLASGDSKTFQTRLEQLSPRAISAVKKLIRTLNEASAEVDIIGTETEIHLDQSRVATLNSRLNELELVENREEIDGVLLGIFPDRQQYEFRIGADGPVMHGPVSEDLDERYLMSSDFAASILLKAATGRFLVVSQVRGGIVQSQQKVLEGLNLKSAVEDTPP